jgi:hypothetical protein
MNTAFLWGTLKERGHTEDTGVDERTKLKWIFKKYGESVGRINVDRDTDNWPALVNKATQLRIL